MSTATNEQTQSAVEALNAVLQAFTASSKGRANSRELFLLATSIVQAAQRLFGQTRTQPDELSAKLAAAITQLGNLDWSRVQFPVSNTLTSQTYADIFTAANAKDDDKNKVLLESLFAFLSLLSDSPEYAQEPILRAIVSDSALTQTVPALPPELNYRANILKIFNPGNVAAVDLEPLHVVIYRGELLGGGFGPELWGLAHIKDEQAHVLLETGEYVIVPAQSLVLAITKDYDTSELPPYLLACAKIFIPAAFEFDSPDITEKLSKNFGSFTKQAFQVHVISAKELESCESVIDNSRWAGQDKRADGAMKSFDIANTDLQIIVTAQHATIRPYITATLVQKTTGSILMRLDVPREFTSRGIYLFPLEDKSATLIVV